jgi:hypothetical protein
MSARRRVLSIAACSGYGRHTGESRIKAHARFHLHLHRLPGSHGGALRCRDHPNPHPPRDLCKASPNSRACHHAIRPFFSSRKISPAATRECLHNSLANRNADLKPFISTKSAGGVTEILEKSPVRNNRPTHNTRSEWISPLWSAARLRRSQVN